MKNIICVALLSLAVPFAFACGDSTSDDSSDGGTTSGTNCESDAECNNGVCECKNDGKAGTSCGPTINDCESQCQVCK